jgi:hypothetical protein
MQLKQLIKDFRKRNPSLRFEVELIDGQRMMPLKTALLLFAWILKRKSRKPRQIQPPSPS